MEFSGKIGCFIAICSLSLVAQAYQSESAYAPDYSYQAPVSTIKNRKKKSKTHEAFESQRWSLIIPSFVVHGIQPDQGASADMPRKIDGNGDAVVTPGIGLQYLGSSGFFAIAAGIKDCYDNLAGTFQVGKMYEITDDTSWGISMGVYARQTPMSCDYQPGPRGGSYNCTTLDNYSWKFMGSVNGQPVDIIPMPFLHFTTAIYRGKDFRVDLKVMGNIVLNEFGIAVPF